jgi:gluconokinase
VGTALARTLGIPFADADDFHPASNIEKMTSGMPLDDKDRFPWREALGKWLATQPDGGIISCSALKRIYRDELRHGCPRVQFVHLDRSSQLIAERLSTRRGHFMPAALLQSQLDTLEPLGVEEHGVTICADLVVESIVAQIVRAPTSSCRMRSITTSSDSNFDAVSNQAGAERAEEPRARAAGSGPRPLGQPQRLTTSIS